MAERTGIAWCDATVNFWWGCQEVSSGCDNCYARVLAAKLWGMGWGPGSERRQVLGAVALARKLQRKAIRVGRRLRVFTNSMSDFFDNGVPVGWCHEAWNVIGECSALDWLILTKRPQNIMRFLPLDWGEGWPHVWLGVSTENQAEADRRIAVLRAIPAALRWVSVEPLLEPFVLYPHLAGPAPERTSQGIGWVVIGGESGPSRRDCGVDAIVDLARQCHAAGVPLFVKQDCARYPDQQGRIPAAWWVREWPASPAGRASLVTEPAA